MKTEPTQTQILIAGDVSVQYYRGIVENDDFGESFWFSDAEDLLCGIQRKIGITDVDGVVERVNEIGLEIVHVAVDPAEDTRLIIAGSQDELRRLARISVARSAISEGLMRAPTFDPLMIGTLLEAAPAAVGEIAFTTAVDRKSRMMSGLLAAVRPDMRTTETPEAVLKLCELPEGDWLSDGSSTIRSFASPSGDFVITFRFLEGESEVDGYVTIGDATLHTRDVGSRAFEPVSTAA